jgi:hypothetical protein
MARVISLNSNGLFLRELEEIIGDYAYHKSLTLFEDCIYLLSYKQKLIAKDEQERNNFLKNLLAEIRQDPVGNLWFRTLRPQLQEDPCLLMISPLCNRPNCYYDRQCYCYPETALTESRLKYKEELRRSVWRIHQR